MNLLMNHRVELRRGSAVSCMSPSRFRLRSRRLIGRLLRRCLHPEQGIAVRAGTAGNDADQRNRKLNMNKSHTSKH